MAKRKTKKAKRVTVNDLCVRLAAVEATLASVAPVLRDAEIVRRRAELEKRYECEQRERFDRSQKRYREKLHAAREQAHAITNDLRCYLDKCTDNPYPPKYVRLMTRCLDLLIAQNTLRRESYALFEQGRRLRKS